MGHNLRISCFTCAEEKARWTLVFLECLTKTQKRKETNSMEFMFASTNLPIQCRFVFFFLFLSGELSNSIFYTPSKPTPHPPPKQDPEVADMPLEPLRNQVLLLDFPAPMLVSFVLFLIQKMPFAPVHSISRATWSAKSLSSVSLLLAKPTIVIGWVCEGGLTAV